MRTSPPRYSFTTPDLLKCVQNCPQDNQSKFREEKRGNGFIGLHRTLTRFTDILNNIESCKSPPANEGSKFRECSNVGDSGSKNIKNKPRISFGDAIKRPFSRCSNGSLDRVFEQNRRYSLAKEYARGCVSPSNLQFTKKISKKQSKQTKEKSMTGKNTSKNNEKENISIGINLTTNFQGISKKSIDKLDSAFSTKRTMQDILDNMKKRINDSLGVTDRKFNQEALSPQSSVESRYYLFDKIKPFSEMQTLTTSIIIQDAEKPQLKLTDFHKGRRLGKGHFGEVFLVRHKQTNFMCALKVISKNHIKQQKVSQQILRQLKIHSTIKHPNCIQMYGYFNDQNNLYILQELCTDGQLYDILKKKRRLSEKYASYLIRQLLEGLRYLHKNMIFHRDLKPENILMQDGVLKICDFGWAVHGLEMRKTRCGTPLYLSPEIVRGQPHDDRVDIWAVGVMTYELLVGGIPFQIWCEQDVKKIALDEVKFPSYLDLSDKAKDFVLKALNKDPNFRISLTDLLFHPFVKDTDPMAFIKEADQQAQ